MSFELTAAALTEDEVQDFLRRAISSYEELKLMSQAKTKLPDALLNTLIAQGLRGEYEQIVSIAEMYFYNQSHACRLLLVFVTVSRATKRRDLEMLNLPFYLVRLLRARGVKSISDLLNALRQDRFSCITWQGRSFKEHLLA